MGDPAISVCGLLSLCVSGRGLKMSMEKQLDVTKLEASALLAADIVSRAVEDWRLLIKKKAWNYTPSRKATDSIPNKHCNFKELRIFFKSDWCDALCSLISENICKETILKILEQELKEAMEKEALSTAV